MPATKIVLQIFVAGALFFKEVISIPTVYSIFGGARGRMSGDGFSNSVRSGAYLLVTNGT
ncbi:hypothetical protein [Enterococcus mundtii]|uniref:hypothetical protein n=1 Tax=Enterococcus mundtii TaxID=53346 RepID=UPI000B1A8EC7|nr:hypothetical protein [Enterococcus mundtii]